MADSDTYTFQRLRTHCRHMFACGNIAPMARSSGLPIEVGGSNSQHRYTGLEAMPGIRSKVAFLTSRPE